MQAWKNGLVVRISRLSPENQYMSSENNSARSKRARFLEKRRELSLLGIGGWVSSRKLQIKSDAETIACRIHRFRETLPYDSVLLPTDEYVSLREAPGSLDPGQLLDVLVGNQRCFLIATFQEFWKAPQFHCVDVQSGSETRVSRVGGNKWYQHDFWASEDGDIQIDLNSRVYFADNVPLPLAVGLQLLLDARRGG